MIILITGTPGSGKTAHAVDMLLDMIGTRPVFADGVTDLAIEHTPCPPVSEWTHEAEDASSATGKKISFTYPPNSIVIIDECQRVFRPRSAGRAVPPEVAAFETHRHLGIDFILITQHPSLVDANIKRLVGKHIHIRVTALGRYRYEWAEVGDPDSRTSREIAQRSKYKLPKRAFSQYKSAELHTKHKFSIPTAVYVIGIGLASLIGISWYIVNSVGSRLKPESQNLTKVTAPAGAPNAPGQKADNAPMTAAEYVEAHKPRITGLLHTAPAYDEITKPQDAPIPVGCIERPKTGDCKCYDQQGNTYRTTPQVCKTIMTDGIFFSWKKQEPPVMKSAPQAQAMPVQPMTSAAPAMGMRAQASSTEPERLAPQGEPATPPPRVPNDSPWRFKG
jgi:zona occludens toxin